MLILGRLCTSALLISLVYVVLTIALVHHLRPSVLSLPRPVNNQQYFLLIDTLAFALVPLVLVPSWDLPSALDKRYNGWQSPQVIRDYTNYARICFERFGDRVKHWLTFNEPWCIAVLGYGIGQFAP